MKYRLPIIALCALLSACGRTPSGIDDKTAIKLMQHCVEMGMGATLEFEADGSDWTRKSLSGVTCREKWPGEK